ncbi:hypothetical protein [Nocardia sp. BMG51109]|nr:hypothetical protein [Nocardia sp. BMG51109]
MTGNPLAHADLVRGIRDHIEGRVRILLTELDLPDPEGPAAQ